MRTWAVKIENSTNIELCTGYHGGMEDILNSSGGRDSQERVRKEVMSELSKRENEKNDQDGGDNMSQRCGREWCDWEVSGA